MSGFQKNFENDLKELLGSGALNETEMNNTVEIDDTKDKSAVFQKNYDADMKGIFGDKCLEKTGEPLNNIGGSNTGRRINYVASIQRCNDDVLVEINSKTDNRRCSVLSKGRAGHRKTEFNIGAIKASGYIDIRKKVSLLEEKRYKTSLKIIMEDKKKYSCKVEGYYTSIEALSWKVRFDKKREDVFLIVDSKRVIAEVTEYSKYGGSSKSFLGMKIPKEYGHTIVIYNENDELEAIFAYAYYISLYFIDHQEYDNYDY